MKTAGQLEELLKSIHRKSYPAYKDTKGSYQFPGFELIIEHVQGDPFASPSRVTIRVKGTQADFPKEYYESRHRRIALQDYLLRRVNRGISKIQFQARGSGKSGLVAVSRPGQEILERTACTLAPDTGEIKLHLEVGFPANGRTIQAFELIKLLFEYFPPMVQECLTYARTEKEVLQKVIWLADDQQYIRKQLPELNLVAFVADGAVLPRENGISDKPQKKAVVFQSPESLKVELELPHKGHLTGMGIPNGVTVIVGGGYHGKSTLLEALTMGVYNHIAGDGREYVITNPDAVKIRAEDGRCIHNIDISLFMSDLPNGKDTNCFSTEDASGSTSQAANVMESLEAGAKVLLIDEDTSATNFMIRDELMGQVIKKEKEPITTFSERVRWLYTDCGISTILVVGSSGVFFSAADTVIQMDTYRAFDITTQAKETAEKYERLHGSGKKETSLVAKQKPAHRIVEKNKTFRLGERIKLKTMGLDGISINKEIVDVRYLEQLADPEQVTALGYFLIYAYRYLFDGTRTMQEGVKLLLEKIKQDGLASVTDTPYINNDFAMPRKQEIFACFNRFRGYTKAITEK